MGWKLDKDGLHIKDFFKQMWPHVRRLLTLERGIKDIGHAYVNIFVEACRIHPYHTGHIFAILFIILLTL